MNKPTKPFQNYFGGKSGSGTYQQIINHIPPHRLRVILFAGNCGIHTNMREAEFHVINDLDTDVVAAWDATGLGVRGDYRLLNMDALTFLRCDIKTPEYERQKKHTFIYLDPPYLMETRKGQLPVYKHEMTVEQHTDLLTHINAMRDHKIMISHYPCDLYDTLLPGWHTFDFLSTIRKGQALERIYYNYELDGHLHDYQYIGGNFRERERHKRIKVNWFKKLDAMEPLLRNAILQEYEERGQIKWI